jgi:hypothetical protein
LLERVDGSPLSDVRPELPVARDRTTIDFARRLAEVIGGYVPPPGV